MYRRPHRTNEWVEYDPSPWSADEPPTVEVVVVGDEAAKGARHRRAIGACGDAQAGCRLGTRARFNGNAPHPAAPSTREHLLRPKRCRGAPRRADRGAETEGRVGEPFKDAQPREDLGAKRAIHSFFIDFPARHEHAAVEFPGGDRLLERLAEDCRIDAVPEEPLGQAQAAWALAGSDGTACKIHAMDGTEARLGELKDAGCTAAVERSEDVAEGRVAKTPGKLHPHSLLELHRRSQICGFRGQRWPTSARPF